MNYKIILDGPKLVEFIEWLPGLGVDECYYLSLFARKKYHDSAKNDKSQCKRATATSKQWLLKKIQQMEIPLGLYTNKDGTPVHNNALALYISVNPRSFAKAQRGLLKRLADTVADSTTHLNPASLAMSAIQKAKSRTCYVDFDFDGVNFNSNAMEHVFNKVINKESYSIIVTRGGFHVLINPKRVNHQFAKTWYKNLAAMPGCDVVGDNLIPVPGCVQGGFCPELIK